ncbi:MAG: tetratricopeptide repeat protein [Promethearchaeota archaeon]
MNSKKANSLILKGFKYMRAEKFDEALDIANKVLEFNSDYYDAYHLKGGVLWHLGQYEESIEEYKKAMSVTSIPELIPKGIRMVNDLLEKIGEEPIEVDEESLVQAAQERKAKEKEERDAKREPIRTKYLISNKKDLYEPNDDISGVAIVTNKSKKRMKIKRFEARLEERWSRLHVNTHKYGATSATSSKWITHGKFHNKIVWNESFVLNPGESKEFQCKLNMPKAWKPKLKKSRHKDWRFELFFKIGTKFVYADSLFIPTEYGSQIMISGKLMGFSINDSRI